MWVCGGRGMFVVACVCVCAGGGRCVQRGEGVVWEWQGRWVWKKGKECEVVCGGKGAGWGEGGEIKSDMEGVGLGGDREA